MMACNGRGGAEAGSAAEATSSSVSGSTSQAETESESETETETETETTGPALSPCGECPEAEVCVASLISDVCGFGQSSFAFTCRLLSPNCGVSTPCENEDCVRDMCGAAGTCETYGCDPEEPVEFTCGRSTCGPSCDIWSADDCPAGEKCTASTCGLNVPNFNTNTCVPITGAGQPGDPCTDLEGSDDCRAGAVCLDAGGGQKECFEFCGGTPGEPICATGELCHIANDGVLSICRPQCDPLGAGCGDAEYGCVGVGSTGFVCLPSQDPQPYGNPCTQVDACAPGLACIQAELVPVPACENAAGCCALYCDTSAMNPCPLMEEQCEPIFASPTAGYENVGVCVQL